ncbi:MAG: bifunctional DNA primase/polymerase, partial [Phycisphaerales bacterium]|nr:bifunctional DNA primase/polymerase [Phycisphaerales bacterium]
MSAATSSIDSTVDSRDLAVRMSVLDAATSYCSRGWSVLPVPYREKNPGLNGWQKLRLKGNDLTAHFNGKPGNIGVLLGEPSGWLIDVDLDHQFCVDMADEYLPPTPLVFGRPGKPRSHWLFKVTAPLPSKRFRSKSAGSLVEIRSTGMQTVFPP